MLQLSIYFLNCIKEVIISFSKVLQRHKHIYAVATIYKKRWLKNFFKKKKNSSSNFQLRSSKNFLKEVFAYSWYFISDFNTIKCVIVSFGGLTAFKFYPNSCILPIYFISKKYSLKYIICQIVEIELEFK